MLDPLSLPLDVPDPVDDDVPVPEDVPDCVGDGVSLALTVVLPVPLSLPVLLGLAPRVTLAVGVREMERERLVVEVGVSDDVGVGDAVGVPDGVPLSLCVDVVEGVPLLLGVVDALAPIVREGVAVVDSEDDSVAVVLGVCEGVPLVDDDVVPVDELVGVSDPVPGSLGISLLLAPSVLLKVNVLDTDALTDATDIVKLSVDVVEVVRDGVVNAVPPKTEEAEGVTVVDAVEELVGIGEIEGVDPVGVALGDTPVTVLLTLVPDELTVTKGALVVALVVGDGLKAVDITALTLVTIEGVNGGVDEGESDAVIDGDGIGVAGGDALADEVGAADPDTVGVILAAAPALKVVVVVGETLGVCEREGEATGVVDGDAVLVTVGDGETEGVADGVSVAVCVGIAELDGVPVLVAVPVELGVTAGVDGGDADTDGVALAAAPELNVVVAVKVTDTVPEGEEDGRGVAEREKLAVAEPESVVVCEGEALGGLNDAIVELVVVELRVGVCVAVGDDVSVATGEGDAVLLGVAVALIVPLPESDCCAATFVQMGAREMM